MKDKIIKQKEKEDALVVKTMNKVQKSVGRLRNARDVAEWAANTVMTSAFEYTLAVDTVLKEELGFTDEQMDGFHESLRSILTALGQVTSYGNNPMTYTDMAVVGQIAKARTQQEKAMILAKKLSVSLPGSQPEDMTKELLG